MVGHYFGLVSGTISASTTGAVAIKDSERLQTVNLAGNYISYTISSSAAYYITKPHLNLEPSKFECDQGHYNTTTVRAQIEISLRGCPFGFTITEGPPGIFACQCTPKPAISHCLIDSTMIIKSKYSATNDYCPLDYCNSLFKISSHHTLITLIKMSSVSTTGLGYSVVPAQRDGAWYWEALNVVRSAPMCGCS